MAYATYAEFIASINSDSLPTELLSQTIIEDALEDAAALILSFICVAYENLSEPYDRAIKRKNIDIAYFYLMERRGFNPGNLSDEIINSSYSNAIGYLEKLQQNKVILSNKADSANNLLNAPWVEV
jgi:phage gp36-like protein